VRDAVLARVARLTTIGRRALEAAAVIGHRIEQSLLERVLGNETEGLAECLKAGMLAQTGASLAFRHELVRQAVLADLDLARSRALNRLALDSLKRTPGRPGEATQLAHHAEGAGEAESVLEFGPLAARAAAEAGAHRSAADQYRRVLGYTGGRPASERARILEAYAEQCEITDQLDEAIGARREAIVLWREATDRIKEGENLAALAWPLVRSAQNAAAEEASRSAIDVLESLPPTRQLASAYRIQAHLRMLDRDREPAVQWGRKAIALAERFQDEGTLAAAEIVVGSAMLVGGDDNGRSHLDRGIAVARRAGEDSLVGLAYLNLGSSYGEQYRFAEAERHLAEGIDYAGDCDLDHSGNYMHAWLALTRLYQGRWSEAADIATSLVDCSQVAIISRIMALVALGRVRARRGDPGARETLDEALELALKTDTLQRVAPVRAARAEAAWLAGEVDHASAEASAAYELALKHRHPWYTGELAYWRHRMDAAFEAPAWAAPPFLLQIRGSWRRAAAAWQALACPYEQARALAEGDGAAQLAGLAMFDNLGAAPAAAALRQRMRGNGLRRIPRGPRASTRRNPYGLTMRELQILGCAAAGLSNREIGSRLHVSPKTVDHHVSSVLGKLGAATRGEAARIAREQNLLTQNGEGPAAI
jgi:DNA-binding CsgD family transcriptional regulator